MKPQPRRYPPPIRKRDASITHLPLSFAQQRLWFLDQLEPGNVTFNIALGVRWSGPLDIAIFERCVSEIVSRHESLRTTFPIVDDKPIQLISPPPQQISLPLVDLSGLPETERAAAVANERRLEVQTSFDLANGPLWRARVLRLAAQEHIVLFTKHHAISDGWSNAVIVREMAALYRAFAMGQRSPLEPLPVQYADYALWQREWLQGDVLDAQVEYWRAQLADVPTRIELPFDRPHTNADTRAGALHTITIPREVVAKLKDIGRREEATLYMVLLAAFATLLSRYSGQKDVLVGTVIAGRQRAELEKL
ncbi:MAG TPA: condensation domain-containing protein, partial [Pyrinomonadaceae bacterium]|nr:condensation domain-containing protein [Pyrinomonadaceae bacterium]